MYLPIDSSDNEWRYSESSAKALEQPLAVQIIITLAITHSPCYICLD
jgi:hypothetical protein